jgi:hypothetical protein
MIGAFVGFSRIFLLRILIFKGLTARRFYKSFGFKGLKLKITGLERKLFSRNQRKGTKEDHNFIRVRRC